MTDSFENRMSNDKVGQPTKVLKPGETAASTEVPAAGAGGLKQVTIGTVPDKVDERLAALKEKFPAFQFRAEARGERQQIIATAGDTQFTVPLLEQMRRTSRGVRGAKSAEESSEK